MIFLIFIKRFGNENISITEKDVENALMPIERVVFLVNSIHIPINLINFNPYIYRKP